MILYGNYFMSFILKIFYFFLNYILRIYLGTYYLYTFHIEHVKVIFYKPKYIGTIISIEFGCKQFMHIIL